MFFPNCTRNHTITHTIKHHVELNIIILYLSTRNPARNLCRGKEIHVSTKQNKTKQNKTKQNKTKQNKTKQNKTIISIFAMQTYKVKDIQNILKKQN